MSETTERQRSVTWEDPRPGAMAAREMSGLEFLQAILRGEQPAAPIAELMGFDALEVEKGRVVFACTPAEYHYNPIGTVHGGMVCTLADSAMGCAVHSTLPAGVGYTTLELKVNLLKAITVETGRLLCEGTTISVGRRAATAEARLTDESGRLYAHATTTCMIFGEAASKESDRNSEDRAVGEGTS